MARITNYDKAMVVFESFQSLMKPFMRLFPNGSITWDTYETSNRIGFEGEFNQNDEEFIRFTSEIKKEEG